MIVRVAPKTPTWLYSSGACLAILMNRDSHQGNGYLGYLGPFHAYHANILVDEVLQGYS